MQVTVEIRGGLNQGYSYTFDSTAVIGRDRTCDLSIPDDPRISRRHARVKVVGKSVVLEDLGSTNGTKIGRRRIHTTVNLDNGQTFVVGHTTLLVTWI